MTQHEVTCFHGTREKHYNIEQTKAFNTGKVKYNKIIKHNQITPEHIAGETPEVQTNVAVKANKKTNKAPKKRANLHLEHKPSDETDVLISAVNDLDLGWKADVCKYTKSHANYGSHCDKPIVLAQVSDVDDDNTQIDEDQPTSNKKEFGVPGDKDFAASQAKAQKFMKKYGNAQDIPDEELPETHDFRDIDGYDYTSYFRDQGHCGSCYTISFTQVMEARLKLKYAKQPPMLSPQFLMTCNYMNEGCEGGWPHFNVFLAENGHLVSEECAPYQHQTKGDHCGNYATCKPISKVANSYLVGGGWGATSERKMMKEILRNGPINGDFQAPSMFSLYKDGIFSEKGLIDLKKKTSLVQIDSDLQLAQLSQEEESDAGEVQEKSVKGVAQTEKLSDVTLNDKGISWMDMNHSVVIVGWGKDAKTGTKYWIVRNSYGPQWGMDGDFYVKRGGNDFGMEVEQIAFEPQWCSDDSTEACNPLQ